MGCWLSHANSNSMALDFYKPTIVNVIKQCSTIFEIRHSNHFFAVVTKAIFFAYQRARFGPSLYKSKLTSVAVLIATDQYFLVLQLHKINIAFGVKWMFPSDRVVEIQRCHLSVPTALFLRINFFVFGGKIHSLVAW
jgi:hypothetical protein